MDAMPRREMRTHCRVGPLTVGRRQICDVSGAACEMNKRAELGFHDQRITFDHGENAFAKPSFDVSERLGFEFNMRKSDDPANEYIPGRIELDQPKDLFAFLAHVKLRYD
ncbi:hypothetical protein [Roseateles violae]|uniref:hypothetical protein n=1 Tax=Roseateles violae TaxID=3058042 RepID=UPI0025B3191F|nr:hypothetical protein [Pelomonas sp. PFR6]